MHVLNIFIMSLQKISIPTPCMIIGILKEEGCLNSKFKGELQAKLGWGSYSCLRHCGVKQNKNNKQNKNPWWRDGYLVEQHITRITWVAWIDHCSIPIVCTDARASIAQSGNYQSFFFWMFQFYFSFVAKDVDIHEALINLFYFWA